MTTIESNPFEQATSHIRYERTAIIESDTRREEERRLHDEATARRTDEIAAYKNLHEEAAVRQGVSLEAFFDGESADLLRSFLQFAGARDYAGGVALRSLTTEGKQPWTGIGYEVPYTRRRPLYLCSDERLRGLYANGVVTAGYIPERLKSANRDITFKTVRDEQWVRRGTEYFPIPGDDMCRENDISIPPHKVTGRVIRTYRHPAIREILKTYAVEMEIHGDQVATLSDRLGELTLSQHVATSLSDVGPSRHSNAVRQEFDDSEATRHLNPGVVIGRRIRQ